MSHPDEREMSWAGASLADSFRRSEEEYLRWRGLPQDATPFPMNVTFNSYIELRDFILKNAESVGVRVVPQGHATVPIKRLVKLHTLIDPPPIDTNGKTYVFKNPYAQETLRRLSDEIRKLQDPT